MNSAVLWEYLSFGVVSIPVTAMMRQKEVV